MTWRAAVFAPEISPFRYPVPRAALGPSVQCLCSAQAKPLRIISRDGCENATKDYFE